eukprot:765830-Hanusia_phi.AAC.5
MAGREEGRRVVEDAAMGAELVGVDDLGPDGTAQKLLQPQRHADRPLQPDVRRPAGEDLAVGVVGRRDPHVDVGEATLPHVLQVAVHDSPHQLLPLLPPLVGPQRQPVHALNVDPPCVGRLGVRPELVGVHGEEKNLLPPPLLLERHDRLGAMEVAPGCRHLLPDHPNPHGHAALVHAPHLPCDVLRHGCVLQGFAGCPLLPPFPAR